MNTDKEYLQHIRRLIEQKLGWTSLSEWRNYEFTELSEKIFDATNIQLSTTTLKRVFGKLKYESLPSSVTLNTLAQYLGFENWMHFKSQQNISLPTLPLKSVSVVIPLKKQIIRKLAIIAIFFTAILISAFGFVVFSKPSAQGSEKVRDAIFNSRPLADGLPNSVVFNVDLKDHPSKNIIIQQSWDSTKTVSLQPGQKEASAIYYIPGYFRAKLIVDGNIIREHDLFIRSNEWMATIDHEPVPTYLNSNELITDNGMTVALSVIDQIRVSSKPITTTFHLVRPFENLHSDHFSMETSFKNIYGAGSSICKTTKVFILCTNGAFIIPFTIPGCASDINLKLGDVTWAGKTNDLSVFGTDPSTGIDLKLEVKKRTARIYLNGKLIRSATYSKNAGDIVGIRYSFLGAGTVDRLLLRDEKGNVAYQETFKK